MTNLGLRQQIVQFLEDESTSVIALTGAWGVGKTYLWEQIKNEIHSLTECEDLRLQVEESLYASLFGVADTKELETRLMASIVSKEASKNSSKKWVDTIKNVCLEAEHCFSKEYRVGRLFGSVIEPFLFPRIVMKRLVVIDDIERKSDAFKADEFLGFIENLARVHKCKVLLILNSQNLTEECSKVWGIFNEKVIDAEYQIKLSPECALEIVLAKHQWDGISEENKFQLLKTLIALEINNIRVIEKIIRKIKHLASLVEPGKRMYLDSKLNAIIIVSAAYYRQLKHNVVWGDFKNFNQYDFNTNNKTAKGRWMSTLVNGLGFNIGDPFNEFYFDFVNTGFVDEDYFLNLIEDIEHKSKEEELNQAVYQLSWDLYWNPNKSAADFDSALVRIINQISDSETRIRPYEFSHLLEAIDKNLLNQNDRKQELINRWVAALESRCREEGLQALEALINDGRIKYLTEQISTELKRLCNQYKGNFDIAEICLKLKQTGGWTTNDEAYLNSLNVDEFKEYIYDIQNENWSIVMFELAKLKSKQPHFGVADKNFRKACEDVLNLEKNDKFLRLGIVLKRILDSVQKN